MKGIKRPEPMLFLTKVRGKMQRLFDKRKE
jgi:hypothetical protein